MRTVQVPLDAGLAIASDTMSGGTQELTNILIDDAGINRPIPGLVDLGLTGLPNLDVIGMYVYGQHLIMVTSDRRIWRRSLGSGAVFPLSDANVPTTLLDGNRRPVFTADSLRVVIAGGGLLQAWSGGALSARLINVTGPTFLNPVATHATFLANHILANDISQPSQLQWSNLGDGSANQWSALNTNSADGDPDPIVALGSTFREVFAFGSKTVQVFGVSGDQFTPFATASVKRFGTLAPYSHLPTAAGFAWLALYNDAPQIIESDGRTATPLSGEVNSDLQAMNEKGRISDCWSFRFALGPYRLMAFVFPSAGKIYLHDGKRWGRAAGWDEALGRYQALDIKSALPWIEQGQLVAGGTGKVLRFDEATRTFDGTPIVSIRQTGHYDYDRTQRKRCLRWRATMRRGQATNSTQALEVAKSDDGGPWSRWWRVPVGTDTRETTVVCPGGIYRRRQYRFNFSGAVDLSLVKFEEDVEDLPT